MMNVFINNDEILIKYDDFWKIDIVKGEEMRLHILPWGNVGNDKIDKANKTSRGWISLKSANGTRRILEMTDIDYWEEAEKSSSDWQSYVDEAR